MVFGVLSISFELALWTIGEELSYYLILGVLVLGLLVNINMVSPHMVYRDRLMETFLSNPLTSQDEKLWKRGAEANKFKLSDAKIGERDQKWSPYHLINTNLVLPMLKRTARLKPAAARKHCLIFCWG